MMKSRVVFSKLESCGGPSREPAPVPALPATCYGVVPINSFVPLILFFLQAVT